MIVFFSARALIHHNTIDYLNTIHADSALLSHEN